MSEYLIGTDNGGTVSKVVIFDLEGNEVHSASRSVNTDYPHEGWGERSLQGVWQSTADAIREALDASGIKPQQILAIGNTGHGNGIYLIDGDGNPTRPAIMSMDSRANSFVQDWVQQGVGDKAWDTTYQQLWPGQPVALLAWLKVNEPDVYKNTAHVLMCKDYIKYCLTGVATTDFTDISATNLFDLQNRNYSSDLLDLYGLSDIQGKLPRPTESYHVAGTVSAQAAQITGLLEGTPVVGGLLDVSASALGAGVIHPGQACIIAGTWSINEVVVEQPIDNRQLFMNSIYTPQTYLAIEASATSATNLDWFVKHFCHDEQREADERGISVYDVCNEKVAGLAPGSTNIIFHPFLFGSNVQATARAGFYGIGGWHEKEHMLRAIYEGVVYGHMSHIEKLTATGIKMESARFTGGAARSHVWSQMFADAIGVPIEVVQGEEIGARGAAMCAGIGAGVYTNHQEAVEKAVTIERKHLPDPSVSSAYRARYKEHQYLTQVMQEAWTRLSELS